MYNYIKGTVTEILADRLVIENNGMGYEILMSNRDINKIYGKEEIKLFTYLHIREDIMQLYGFIDKSDKDIFLKLIEVSKIGTKTAIGILSQFDADSLALALESNDIDMIAKCPGIGKKTAQRMILELKGKLIISDNKISDNSMTSFVSEAYEAMTGLGFEEKIINKIFNNIENIDKLDTSEIVKIALKEMNNA